ncbi:hypothetical protein [Bradyrhizobium erythrophlei]|jgi:hypothetical protein|uniref:Uncharacterized protein n=1 Tax=Bradyrhizobium erythrophlei TaxID=1437360 RepID=A0A1M5PP36_9BRAD|nr:hypothetical protein [Bradyrhizobium erythrophlei]SHH03527.1 hypothetical protein SAMN05444169_5378 [Bradyrhizobium erythrophlei]
MHHSIDGRRLATSSIGSQITDEENFSNEQIKYSIDSYRYELVHGEDADFIAYQRKFGDGLWQTVSTWMIPRTECR